MSTSSRTFRVFISFTFNDLRAERDELQKHVFPRLKELCRRNGCRFLAVDLRWGVSEEVALDQRTMRLCLEEVARSRRVSPVLTSFCSWATATAGARCRKRFPPMSSSRSSAK